MDSCRRITGEVSVMTGTALSTMGPCDHYEWEMRPSRSDLPHDFVATKIGGPSAPEDKGCGRCGSAGGAPVHHGGVLPVWLWEFHWWPAVVS